VSQIDRVFFDVASACNLACPFCVFDWSSLKKGSITTPEVLAKVFSLLPYLPQAGMSLSCAHEPTMHPRLAEILRDLPEGYRKKFFMTTNMANRMSDDLIDAIATCGIEHLNISCDTLDARTFLYLRKGGKLADFLQNMDRLGQVLRTADPERRPRVRFITMGFRVNYREIPDIVEYGERFGAVEHEVRYLFDVPHVEEEFTRREILDEESWRWLGRFAKEKPGLQIFAPPEGYKYAFQRSGDENFGKSGLSLSSATRIKDQVDDGELLAPLVIDASVPEIEIGPKKSVRYKPRVLAMPRTANGTVPPYEKLTLPPTLHISPEGSVMVGDWGKERFEINILSIGDPGKFFSALLDPGEHPFAVEREGGFRLVRFGQDVWSDMQYAMSPEFRQKLWDSNLHLEVFSAAPISLFRVAFAAQQGEEFPAVKERYVEITAGRTLCSFRISDLVDLRPGLSPENLTHIYVGGQNSEPAEVHVALRIGGFPV